MRRAVLVVAGLGLMHPALAQEQDEWTSSFTRIKGGAVYDYRVGLDGATVSEDYLLTHVVCSDGSRSLRVMLPLAPEDNDTGFTLDGEPSTLKKTGGTHEVVVTVNGKRQTKVMELKSVNDPASHYRRQFMFRVEHGDALWRAMTDGGNRAKMLIGSGGTPITIPPDEKLMAALRSCGLTE